MYELMVRFPGNVEYSVGVTGMDPKELAGQIENALWFWEQISPRKQGWNGDQIEMIANALADGVDQYETSWGDLTLFAVKQ